MPDDAPAEVEPTVGLAGMPRPRKHYHRYFASPAPAHDMDSGPEQVAAFPRAYFHHKSADWLGSPDAGHAHELAEAISLSCWAGMTCGQPRSGDKDLPPDALDRSLGGPPQPSPTHAMIADLPLSGDLRRIGTMLEARNN